MHGVVRRSCWTGIAIPLAILDLLWVAPSLHAAPDSVSSTGWVERGKASFYGDSFDGTKTASGERFDKDSLTAAHRTLPMGTKVSCKLASKEVSTPGNAPSLNR